MILLDRKHEVAAWVLERLPNADRTHFDGRWFEGLGFLDAQERLCGGVIYYNFTGEDIEAAAAGEGQWLTPLKVRAIFLYPFVQLGCERMTAWVAKSNNDSRRFVERLGFVMEGVKRRALPRGENEIMYGMLKRDCRWIADGKEIAKAA